MKKQLPTDVISKELAQSVFFQKTSGEKLSEQAQKSVKGIPSQSPTPPTNDEGDHSSKRDVVTDVMIDVITSQLQDINFKKWQEIIEDTETQNSALRLTSEERYEVEDVVNELRRKYGIKTSMNEVARLGLLLLIHDFKKNKKESMIHKVKKA